MGKAFSSREPNLKSALATGKLKFKRYRAKRNNLRINEIYAQYLFLKEIAEYYRYTSKMFPWTDSSFSSRTKRKLVTHIQETHRRDATLCEFICGHCRKIFTATKNLLRHLPNFPEFPKMYGATGVPKFMETNRVSKIISRTNTLLFLQERENEVIVSPCHKWHRFFQPIILASKYWGWTFNNRASIRCLLSWKIVLYLPLSLIWKELTIAYCVLFFVKLNCRNLKIKILSPLLSHQM